MNPDKTYTYAPHWTMEMTDDSAKSKVIINAVPELPFWWFLNPWLTVQHLAEERARLLKQCDSLKAGLADSLYDLQNELESVKAERDAANDAVRTLRNQRKKGKRHG